MFKNLLLAIIGSLMVFSSPVPQLNKDKVRLWGQYVQFNQRNIDWSYTAKRVKAAGYNGFTVHGDTRWGSTPTAMPWTYLPNIRKYDLSRPNPHYRLKVREFLEEMGGKGDLTLSVSLFSFYHRARYDGRTALLPHPFRQNIQGITWDDNVECLGESKPWFCHVAWKTEGDKFKERVVSYRIIPKYRWLWAYINLWGQEIARAAKKYPSMEPVLIRYVNESHTRYRNGEAVNIEGGEDKIVQILMQQWETFGLVHGRDYRIVNDWTPFEGTTPLWDDWLNSINFDRQFGWFKEIHNVHPQAYTEIRKFNFYHNRTIYSTDSVKPEDATFDKKSRFLYCSDARLADLKVPSDRSPYYNFNFRKTFDAVWPIMKRIATCNSQKTEQQ